MNHFLQRRLKHLNHYIDSLTPAELGIAAPIRAITRSTISHGDHNLIVKLRITDRRHNVHARCLRIDASDSPEYKRKEYKILTILEGHSVGPHVYSYKERPPLLVREWIEDVQPLPTRPGAQRTQWITDCAALYNTMHGIPIYEHLAAEDRLANPLSRYADFIHALQNEGQRRLPSLEEFQRECLERILTRDVPDLTAPTAPSMTQLSPKAGNLVLRQRKPFFLDWDTARFTDKERDIALFIGVHLRTLAEVKAFLRQLRAYNPLLVSLYLQPVMLWSDFRGGYQVTSKELDWFETVRQFISNMRDKDDFS